MFLILRKPRTPLYLLRIIISKRHYFKRGAETTSRPAEMPNPCNAVHVTTDITIDTQTDIHATHSPRRDTLCSKDIDAIVNQLAALAETVSQSSHSSTTPSERSSSSVLNSTTTQPGSSATKKTQEDDEDEDESFGYLRSLITISEHSSTSSITDDSDSRSTGRRRASSRLSLRFEELPGLSFPKVSRNPCPRYTPVPPAWTPKPIPTRPEVRF